MPQQQLDQMTKADLIRVLDGLLEKYITPSFGSLPKREIDLEILEALVSIGYLGAAPSVYELISKLKVTRSKARSLLYDRELRRLADGDLRDLAVSAVVNAAPHKDGDLFVLEVENPYALDHLKHLVQQSGHAADGSFSASIVRLSLDAYSNLVAGLLDERQKKVVHAALVKAGAPEKTFQGVLKGVLRKLGAKAASEAGAEVAEDLGGYVGCLISEGTTKIVSKFSGILKKDEDSGE